MRVTTAAVLKQLKYSVHKVVTTVVDEEHTISLLAVQMTDDVLRHIIDVLEMER